MNSRKFHVGQIVHFSEPEVTGGAPRGDHRVERFQPPDSDEPQHRGEHQYRVKATGDGNERLARESQLNGRLVVETLAQSLYEAVNATKVPWARRDRTVRAPWLKAARLQMSDVAKKA